MIDELWSRSDVHALETLRRTFQTRRRSDVDQGLALFEALVAIEGCDRAAASEAMKQLRSWAGEVRSCIGTQAPWQLLSRVLHEGESFVGDTEDYTHPDNSKITRVITRRRGQPILLSSIWLVVGRLAGLDVVGVSLPGHFIVRAGQSFLDPFNGGGLLSTADCTRIAQRVGQQRPWGQEGPRPAGVSAMAKRTLRNLRNGQDNLKDRRGVYRSTRLLSELSPNEPKPMLRLAQLSEEFGAYREAARIYRELSETFEDSREARIAEIRGLAVIARSRTLN